MHWIFIALITAFSYGVYNFFIKVSSDHIHQIVGAVVLQIVAALFGVICLVVLRFTDTTFEVSPKGLKYAILAGVFVGIAEIASFYLFSKGVAASVGIPVIIGGTIVVGAALGMVFLKESLAWFHYLAVLLVLIGTVILATK